MRISDWSSDVCSSDLIPAGLPEGSNARGADLGKRAVADTGHVRHGAVPQAAAPRERAARAALASRSSLPTGKGPSGLRRKVRPLMVSGVNPATFSRMTPSGPTRLTRKRHQAGLRAASAQTRIRSFAMRSEEHTSELQSLIRISVAVFC